MKQLIKKIKRNRGMTYVELIVVLSIFSILSSVAIYNYGDFEARVDIKNLASDIALKIVEAQKSALSGSIPALTPGVSPWRPAYGVYFQPFGSGADNKNFIYFTDLNNDTFYSGSGFSCVPECLNKIAITKNNSISALDVFYLGDAVAHHIDNVVIIFTRPSSGAVIRSSTPLNPNIDYIRITVASPKGMAAAIKLYPSGRVQVN